MAMYLIPQVFIVVVIQVRKLLANHEKKYYKTMYKNVLKTNQMTMNEFLFKKIDSRNTHAFWNNLKFN